MKPPRWSAACRCSECLYIGQIKKYDIYICDFVTDYVILISRSGLPEDIELDSATRKLVSPYFSKGKLNNLYKAMLLMKQ